MIFYPRSLLPGFVIMTRELEDYLSICFYIMPGGKVQPEELYHVYLDLLQSDPYIRRALGPNVVLTPFQSCPVRVGGVPKAFGKQFLVIGDAAGQVDPLTGRTSTLPNWQPVHLCNQTDCHLVH